eukprot:m.241928 g.241928  ORF g.241928 m.241928 type:complete len:79 (-) comp19430_c0_seq4:518-754(-)
MVDSHSESVPKATKQQMADAGIPLAWRDSCAAILIPLNECRRKQMFAPWECEHERHAYEVCQYKEYLARMKDQMKKAH